MTKLRGRPKSNKPVKVPAPRGRPRIHSDAVVNEIYRLWDEGELGYLLIGKTLGLSKHTVRYWIKKRDSVENK